MESSRSRGEALSVLNRCPDEALKPFVDALLIELEQHRLEVLENRTGLVMLPGTDNAQGVTYHLGEVLVSEARVRLAGVEGYTLRLGRDLESALAVAILDAARGAGLLEDHITPFVLEQARMQAGEDEALLRQIEATRVEMETF